jgi:NAD(P)-dependent dehydrogenase (short-subunit alcohol dehydrogenase family)
MEASKEESEMDGTDKFKDKTVIVTGGASGIGRALGEELGKRGARIVLADLNEVLLGETVTSLKGRGYKIAGTVIDVTDFKAVKRLVEDSAREYGELDYIFNNAGIAMLGEAADMSIDDWRNIIDVNLYGVVNGSIAAYEVMLSQGHGHIVNTASLAGLLPLPGTGPYTASKYGVVGLSEVLRMEGKKYGVKVSVVCPGVIKTPIYSNIKVAGLERGEVEELTPFGTPPEKCARAILRGVEKDRGIIRVSGLTHLLYAMQRISPSLIRAMGSGMLEAFRAGKKRINAKETLARSG